MDRQAARQIEWDCTQLIYSFYGYLDENRYEDLANLFAPDGCWTRLGEPLVGPQAILEAMREREDWLTAHLVSNVRVKVFDAARAETVQYITLYRHEGYDPKSGPAPVVLPLGVLRHADQLVCIKGTWKFQLKTSRAIMTDRQRVTHYDKPKA